MNSETAPLDLEGILPLALNEDQIEFWRKLQPVNRTAATDTYKRTMGTSGEVFNQNASYSLAARRALNEKGADGRLIMAGLERLLYPWFGTKVTEKEVRKAEGKFRFASEINRFPTKIWEDVLANDGFFNLDIYGFPGGQTFLVKKQDGNEVPMHVPCLSVEGPGALVSHIEPHVLNGYAPIIAATKARLMREAVGEKFDEFGYRGARNDFDHAILMMALKVGGDYFYTSNDETVFLFANYFTSIGTMGHEYIEAFQKDGRSLEEAQEMAARDFIEHNEKSALLPDTIDTIKSGLPLILKLIKEYKGKGKVIMPRFDSGNQKEQILVWKKMTLEAGIERSPMVLEDGYTPEKGKEIKEWYRQQGYDPDELIIGAGGYFQQGNTRDAISLAYKRTSTEYDGKHHGSIKFSDSPGKFSLPGPIRVYEQGSNLIVALKEESIDGIPLYVPLLKNGRINYFETLDGQADRTNRTWNRYDRIEYSPLIKAIIAQRTSERDAIRARL